MVSEPSIGQCANEDAGLQGGWIVRSHIGWRGERNISYKGVETSLEQTRFKTLRGSPGGKAQRGQYLLAVDLDCYKWYQSQALAVCQGGRWAPRGWIVRSHIGWRGERNISYKGVETSP